VYSGRTKELVEPILQRFSRDTGIAVDIRYGDSADLALQLDTEGDQSPADVFISQSPGALDYLSGKARLAPLPPATLDKVDARVRSPKGEWVGLSGRVRVLVYNTEQMTEAQLPASVFDLVQPQYKDKVGVSPTNGSFQDFVTSMRRAVGDDKTLEWLRGMKANGARTFANNTAIVQAVGRGEFPLGLVNHYYNERAKAEDPGVKSANHAFADDDLGNLILVTGMATLTTAKDKVLAERLVNYLLDVGAQEYFAKETFEYPVAAGVKPVVDLPPLTSIKAPQQDLSELGDLAQTARLIDQSGLNSG
jgi:iron(III) transport system substrate-binding protein